jgi:hypothetical protein
MSSSIIYYEPLGIFVTVLIAVTILLVRPFFVRHLRKVGRYVKLLESEGKAFKQFRESKATIDGDIYNKIRLRRLAMDILNQILSVFVVAMPCFAVYYHLIKIDNWLYWFIFYMTISIITGVIINKIAPKLRAK